MRMLLPACVLLPFFIASGCSSKGPPTATTVAAKPSIPRSTAEVTLTEATAAEIDAAVKDADKAVVLVEFWSLATEPSPELGLAANTRGGDQQARGATLGKDKVAWHGIRKAEYMAHKYEGYFLRVISVNVDGPAKKDEVFKYLKTHNARHVTNFLWKEDPSTLAERYGFKGTAPHQAVFGRNGTKVWSNGESLPGTLDDFIFAELDK